MLNNARYENSHITKANTVTQVSHSELNYSAYGDIDLAFTQCQASNIRHIGVPCTLCACCMMCPAKLVLLERDAG